MLIEAHYHSVDGCSISKKYKTRKGLAKFVDEWVGLVEKDGKNGATIALDGYRVSFDGIGVVEWNRVA